MADLKKIAQRFNDEVFNQGKVDALDEIVADDYVEHQVFPGLEPGRDGLKKMVLAFREAFPDIKISTLATMTDGDEVFIHSNMAGTHKGEFAGIPATGKKISVDMIDRLRFRGDQAVEHWGVSDDMGMMTQLGVIPEMG